MAPITEIGIICPDRSYRPINDVLMHGEIPLPEQDQYGLIWYGS
jgi:hypothetical protein